MPGFDTLGARLARSRRRLERERAAVKIERLDLVENDIPGLGDGACAASASNAARAASAQIIMFPRQNRRNRD
jgi:hypothetical protein